MKLVRKCLQEKYTKYVPWNRTVCFFRQSTTKLVLPAPIINNSAYSREGEKMITILIERLALCLFLRYISFYGQHGTPVDAMAKTNMFNCFEKIYINSEIYFVNNILCIQWRLVAYSFISIWNGIFSGTEHLCNIFVPNEWI